MNIFMQILGLAIALAIMGIPFWIIAIKDKKFKWIWIMTIIIFSLSIISAIWPILSVICGLVVIFGVILAYCYVYPVFLQLERNYCGSQINKLFLIFIPCISIYGISDILFKWLCQTLASEKFLNASKMWEFIIDGNEVVFFGFIVNAIYRFFDKEVEPTLIIDKLKMQHPKLVPVSCDKIGNNILFVNEGLDIKNFNIVSKVISKNCVEEFDKINWRLKNHKNIYSNGMVYVLTGVQADIYVKFHIDIQCAELSEYYIIEDGCFAAIYEEDNKFVVIQKNIEYILLNKREKEIYNTDNKVRLESEYLTKEIRK